MTTITKEIIENYRNNVAAHNALQNTIFPGREKCIITSILNEDTCKRLEKDGDALFEAISALKPNAIVAMSDDIEAAIGKIVATEEYVNYDNKLCAIAAARDVLHF